MTGMSPEGDFQALQDNVSACLVDTTRTVGQIANEDLPFQRSVDPSIGQLIDRQNARILQLSQRLFGSATSGTEVTAPSIQDAEAVEDNWRGIVDVIDSLLEKADASLDEYTGVIKRLSPSARDAAEKAPSVRKSRPEKAYRDQKDITKPQLLFNTVPSNRETTPFKPLLRTKPNAMKSLEDSCKPTLAQDGTKSYEHPYEVEIRASTYPSAAYYKKDPILYLPYESTKATLVDTLEAVSEMLDELRKATEIAIDLEHHDTHSYIGLVSLMQISTRDKDWVVDTLKPWREELQILNEVFTDPKIIKVLHGSYMDMIWLQRDLGLYVVGLFDTFHASRALGYPRNGLAYLLERFAGFHALKQYQMADWRIRPLPKEMFNYARSDTHFLLYIYDNMRNELIEKSEASQTNENFVANVLEASKEEALQRYERPIYDAERGSGSSGWYGALIRTPALFTQEQFAVFRAVHKWRDDLARSEDEGLHTIMSKGTMFNIAQLVPNDMPSLLGCSHPITPAVKLHSRELLVLIRNAKANAAQGPEMKDIFKDFGPRPSRTGQDIPKISMSLPSILARERQNVDATLLNVSVRSDQSKFWGPILAQPGSEDSRNGSTPTPLDLRLALPLPRLTAEVFTDTQGGSTSTPTKPKLAVPEHAYVKERKTTENHVFVIKELGGPKKRKAEDLQHDPLDDSGNTEALPCDEDTERVVLELAEQKAALKAQKKLDKARRKEEQAQKRGGTHNNGEKKDEEVFDYAKAPSVLHAKQDDKERQRLKKSFSPYSKSLDAPKGMRKANKEIPGKSFTFKK